MSATALWQMSKVAVHQEQQSVFSFVVLNLCIPKTMLVEPDSVTLVDPKSKRVHFLGFCARFLGFLEESLYLFSNIISI